MSAPTLADATLPELIRAIRRRCRERAERAVIRIGDLLIDVAGGTATFGGRAVVLTPRELDVLVALAGAHPVGLTAPDLLALVWGDRDPDAAALTQARVYARVLRRKLPGLLAPLPRGSHRYRLAVDARRASAA